MMINCLPSLANCKLQESSHPLRYCQKTTACLRNRLVSLLDSIAAACGAEPFRDATVARQAPASCSHWQHTCRMLLASQHDNHAPQLLSQVNYEASA
jgi:hypothetical protein